MSCALQARYPVKSTLNELVSMIHVSAIPSIRWERCNETQNSDFTGTTNARKNKRYSQAHEDARANANENAHAQTTQLQ